MGYGHNVSHLKQRLWDAAWFTEQQCKRWIFLEVEIWWFVANNRNPYWLPGKAGMSSQHILPQLLPTLWSRVADSHSASQEIPRLVWNPKFQYRVHKSPLDPVMSQMNPVHIFIRCFFKIRKWSNGISTHKVRVLTADPIALPTEALHLIHITCRMKCVERVAYLTGIP